MRTLYFDCPSGAAGDMLLGALIDAGAPIEQIRRALSTLEVEGWSLEFEEVTRAGLRAGRAVVDTDTGPARSWREIEAMLVQASLEEAVRDRALGAFQLLAAAEARIHGTEIHDVVFHEVGALDAIVDIVGGCAAVEHFMPARVLCSPVAAGSGSTAAAHGSLPVPAPAVLEIAAATELVVSSEGEGELLTPTGAALLATWADGFGSMPAMTISSVGYGAGTGERDVPNVVRAVAGETVEDSFQGEVLIQTNLDDMAPELVPHAIDSLIAAGAGDAWASSILMKKGRPAFLLSALCPRASATRVLETLYRETTTLGARLIPISKDVLDRRWIETTVAGQTVRVKIGLYGGEVVTAAPEHDDATAVAEATGMPLKEIYERARAEARAALGP
jgi:pyridinium-3,5-bisthiocarboxylic acid mononucleotide nickel chelatase